MKYKKGEKKIEAIFVYCSRHYLPAARPRRPCAADHSAGSVPANCRGAACPRVKSRTAAYHTVGYISEAFERPEREVVERDGRRKRRKEGAGDTPPP